MEKPAFQRNLLAGFEFARYRLAFSNVCLSLLRSCSWFIMTTTFQQPFAEDPMTSWFITNLHTCLWVRGDDQEPEVLLPLPQTCIFNQSLFLISHSGGSRHHGDSIPKPRLAHVCSSMTLGDDIWPLEESHVFGTRQRTTACGLN